MKNDVKAAVAPILIVAVALVMTMWCAYDLGVMRGAEKENDTMCVTVVDTVPYYVPVPKDSVVVRYRTVLLPKVVEADSCREEAVINEQGAADSCLVEVPISRYEFCDSTYKLKVSGFGVSLDYIETYGKTVFVTKREKAKRWGFGVQIGTTFDGGLRPYIGVGVSYNVLFF